MVCRWVCRSSEGLIAKTTLCALPRPLNAPIPLDTMCKRLSFRSLPELHSGTVNRAIAVGRRPAANSLDQVRYRFSTARIHCSKNNDLDSGGNFPVLGSVEIHLELMTAAAREIIAVKL